jgi:hypothetical protein
MIAEGFFLSLSYFNNILVTQKTENEFTTNIFWTSS